MMEPLDLLNTSLAGSKLIESSAGTGKTFAIASLYVRLLLERRLQVNQILVVTFTEAATADLKRRIRERLEEACHAFETGKGKDDFLGGLLAKVTDWKDAHKMLSGAMATLDEAAIFTIHGFCQRVLQENAFESAALFEAEFVTTQDNLIQEIADDFWRIEFYPASALCVQYALRKGWTPEALLRFVRQGLSWLFLKVIPSIQKPSPAELKTLEASVLEDYESLSATWEKSKSEVRQILLQTKALNRNIYRVTTVEANLEAMEGFLVASDPMALPQGFERFCSSKLAGSVTRNNVPPKHEFFDQCESFRKSYDRLCGVFDALWLAQQVAAASFVRQQLRQRKQQQSLRFFDDLLLDLYEVLQRRGGEGLAKALRIRYPAALIDEFQDTDPIQYGIFNAIYSDSSCALFLIGDPKQAIYGFRGADVFAYIQASRDASESYTLLKNWRSSPRLVEAVNSLFLNCPNPFILSDIGFHRVEAAATTGKLAWHGKPDMSPLKCWLAKRLSGEGQPINKGDAREVLSAAVAAETVRMLQGGAEGHAQLDGRPLGPQDIAILVRTNHEAGIVHKALVQARVPSVIYTEDTVLSSDEARELQRILAAIAEPGHEGRIRAALATTVFGFDGQALAQLAADEAVWEEWLKAFVAYRDLWVEAGFMTMAATLITRQQVRRRLLTLSDGERRLTNLLHCCQLLHQAALQERLGIEELLRWLAKVCQGGQVTRVEEQQIRLETDEQAVKIVTIHKSKGLEYPVVFCPFCWDTFTGKEDVVTFHDPDTAEIVQDVGSPDLDRHKSLAKREALAENARLLYVALTRAKELCVVSWGAFRDAGKSAMAWLLHPLEGRKAEPLHEIMEEHFTKLDDQSIQSQLESLAAASHGALQICSIPASSTATYRPPALAAQDFTCRTLRREIARDWGLSSFSAIVSGRSRAGEQDRDSLGTPPVPVVPSVPPGRTFLDFPRGIRAGTALHEMLETLEFSLEPEEDARQLVREKLAQFGFEPHWQEPVWQMLQKVMSTPLDPDQPELHLSRLERRQRLHEVEFSFPLDLLTSRKLKAAFAVHRGPELPESLPEALERLDFAPVRGAMRGFIDLVFEWNERFYLADWKSNFLGSDVSAYDRQALRESMVRELYVLQYHLYVVALDRYLSFRVPGYRYRAHFGGVYYLFLRGMDPAHGFQYGVYSDRPSESLIRELSRCLNAT